MDLQKIYTTRRTIFVTSDEGLNYATANRCFSSDSDICKELGFTESERRTFVKRSQRLYNSFVKNGFMPYEPIKAFDLNGMLYIADGQGRMQALMLYNANHEEKISIPCDVYKISSYEEMMDAIRLMNSFKTNWTKYDIMQSEIKTLDNQEEKSKLELSNYYSDLIFKETNLSLAKGTILITLFGQGAMKAESEPIKKKVFPQHKEFFEWYINLVKSVIKSNKWDKREIKSLTTQKFFELLKTFLYSDILKHPLGKLHFDNVLKALIYGFSNEPTHYNKMNYNDKIKVRKVMTSYLKLYYSSFQIHDKRSFKKLYEDMDKICAMEGYYVK